MWMLLADLCSSSVHLVDGPCVARRLVGCSAQALQRLFALVSLGALVLIVFGYGHMQGLGRGNPQLWVPPWWARHLTMLLMVPAMVLLVAAYVPSRIRMAVRHPMLMGVTLWAMGHLLANGDLASALLFGSFFAYGLYDIASATQRAALGPLGTAQGSAAGDAAAIAGGLALYGLLLFWGHRWLTGVPRANGRRKKGRAMNRARCAIGLLAWSLRRVLSPLTHGAFGASGNARRHPWQLRPRQHNGQAHHRRTR
jgi:uncharacterized membrane protein